MSKRKFLGYRLKYGKDKYEPYVIARTDVPGWMFTRLRPTPVNSVTLLRLCVLVSEFHSRCIVPPRWHPSDLRIVRVYSRQKKVSR